MDCNNNNNMMRKRRDRPIPGNPTIPANPAANSVSSSASSSMAAKKLWVEENQVRDAGVDELLAGLGYDVRSSDMAEVAQKIEQLEMVMGNGYVEDISNLSVDDAVYYNPSDLSSWLESMLSEINPPEFSSSTTTTATTTTDTFAFPRSAQIYDEPTSSNYDLSAIPGEIVYGERTKNKKTKYELNHHHQQQQLVVPDSCSSSSTSAGVSQSGSLVVVVVDSQETGVRLVHTLMACAEAVQQNNLAVAEALATQIGPLAASQSGAMKKVANYFAEALASRIYQSNLTKSTLSITNYSSFSSFSQILHQNFYRSCPYLQFAHLTSNQAILKAFVGEQRVHVIDFGIKHGTQWPQLIQALALREGGPPTIRLTGIARPDSAGLDPVQEIGWKLAGFAEKLRVGFEFQGLVVESLADLDSETIRLREGEAVAVNSVFELHELLARPGSVEKVLGLVRAVRPSVVTVVEQEANHNGPVFVDRFNEALHYYSTMFDSLESRGGGSDGQDLVMSEMYLGSQIFNVVACEGADRVERHETSAQWKTRFVSAGFEPVHLGSSGFNQASDLVSLFGNGDGHRVEEKNGCLTLGWYTRPLIATSAWQLGSNTK